MGAQQRVFKAKINSTKSLRKIFKAMELIAASRIQKAISRVQAATPYSDAITKAVGAVATHSRADHVLTTEPESIRRSAVVVFGPDRGFAGAYASSVIRKGEELSKLLHEQGREAKLYVIGGKAETYHNFRGHELAAAWTGFSENPTVDHVREIGKKLLDDFVADYEDGGTDEIYLVYTRFVNSVTQTPVYKRLLPLNIVDIESEDVVGELSTDSGEAYPLYEFEPSAAEVLNALLPRYFEARIWDALLNAGASEQANRQQAMKTATDNADDLIRTYTRLANTARQAEITQEITEIVGGADALASSGNAD